MPLDPVARYRLSLIDQFMTPEVRKEHEEWKQLVARTPQVPVDDPATIARMKRAMAKPDLNYLCKSVGDGE